MPTFTPADALIQAADSITSAVAGVAPLPNMTTDAIDQLMHIFKQQAKTAKNGETVQRVLKECAHAERVLTKAEPNPTPTTTPSAMPTANPTTTFPELKNEYSDSDVGRPRQTPVVSQDYYESISPPSAKNTRHQRRGRTIIEDFLFHMMDVPTPTQPFTNQYAASHKFPLQFLCNFASVVLDDKTRDLLEYCHLLKHPKYKDLWSKSFWQGNLMTRNNHQDHCLHGKARYIIPSKKIGCNYHPEKKDPHHTGITMGGNFINYPDDCGTPTADILTVKLQLNSIISTPNSKFMTIDIKGFYLMMPMECYEYYLGNKNSHVDTVPLL